MVSGHPSFPGQLLPRAIVPHEIPLGAINPGLFPPRQLTLSNSPGQVLLRHLPSMKSLQDNNPLDFCPLSSPHAWTINLGTRSLETLYLAGSWVLH